MSTDQINPLMIQVETAVEQEDWNHAISLLQQILQIDPQNLSALISLGTCLLNTGNAEEAIPHFEGAARLAPDQTEVHNNLGVAYYIAGKYTQAEIAYKEALWLDDDDVQAWMNLAQLYLQISEKTTEGVQILASVVQAHPENVEALFQLALCYEIGEDDDSAEFLLRRILGIQPDHALAKEVLNDVLERKKGAADPAEQKSAASTTPTDLSHIAKPEHTQKLAGLKALLKDNPPPPTISPSPLPAIPSARVETGSARTAALFASEEFSSTERLHALSVFYRNQGYNIQLITDFEPEMINKFESLIFYNPNLSGNLIDGINRCIQNGKGYAVDLDLDFMNLPADHPAYSQFGPGNPNAKQVLQIILGDAQQVTTASQVMAERYQPFAKRIDVALPSWDRNDTWWNRPAPARDTLNIGWLGAKTDLPELLEYKTPLWRFFKEFPSSTWVVVGNADAAGIFPQLPEERQLFQPPPTSQSLSFIFKNIDLLIVPLRQNNFNQARSDQSLLYAGIRRIPWVASPIPAFQDWGVGGMIANSPNDWYTSLKNLAQDVELYKQMGLAGRNKADER